MSLRFFRRVSLIPGLRLNASRGGLSRMLIRHYRGPLTVLAFRAAAGQSQTPSEVNLTRQYNA
jgi:hypothetical protein